ncbi:unnamed protein product [Owenia fusiformis]|uniref:Uncharacterized protein n=1 Tax=Owenia fusiformis TaxID=6347 RepID=A0A8S4PVJ3_OWEFU|nr:unnamed protein product [Owenia fusiformis]
MNSMKDRIVNEITGIVKPPTARKLDLESLGSSIGYSETHRQYSVSPPLSHLSDESDCELSMDIQESQSPESPSCKTPSTVTSPVFNIPSASSNTEIRQTQLPIQESSSLPGQTSDSGNVIFHFLDNS